MEWKIVTVSNRITTLLGTRYALSFLVTLANAEQAMKAKIIYDSIGSETVNRLEAVKI